jgi:hypothetical protein
MTDHEVGVGPVRRLTRAMRRRPIATAIGGLLSAGVAVWLVVGVFGFHLLFIDDKVDEANPFAPSSPTSVLSPSSVPTLAGDGGTAAPEPTSPPEVAVSETHRGTFVDRSKTASGIATVITDGATAFLRFEDFKTDNGPDLFVYLSAGVTTTSPSGTLDDDFVDLGRLKGNIGSQNYELPPGIDLTKYRTVVIWCKRFTSAFGAADLEAAVGHAAG